MYQIDSWGPLQDNEQAQGSFNWKSHEALDSFEGLRDNFLEQPILVIDLAKECLLSICGWLAVKLGNLCILKKLINVDPES